jgi:hypothetical protein
VGKIIEKTRGIFENAIYAVAFIIMAVGGLFTLVISLRIINEAFGPIVSLLGFFIFPVVIAVAPIYAAAAWGDWFPIIVVYGLWIIIMVLFGIAKAVSRE